ncbi:MAG: methylated-DNA--[protein]-cysteine S-methyltransferase [Xanthobacteraceae bacterium]|nr:methylated-DNA--[protein]-cysteine S-methyltransferase [Xanthobacteraceae bacterium]
MTYVYTRMTSPVGTLKLVASERGLAAIVWADEDPARVRLGPATEDRAHPLLREAQRQLAEYFRGERRTFALQLDFVGTAFQKKVWRELLRIPYGQTQSYSAIAGRLGNAGASRAVGAANGKNPIAIVAPCHRLIGASGALRGYAGGLAAKRRLLELEGNGDALAAPPRRGPQALGASSAAGSDSVACRPPKRRSRR